jgi:RNA methyltransferase, TrmH family
VALQTPAVESRQNPRFKLWLDYTRHPESEQCPWVPVEGWKQLAELNRHPIELLLFSDPADPRLTPLRQRAKVIVQLKSQLLELLSQVEASQSILGFLSKPSWTWPQLRPWVLYLDRLQDPGNLGTLFRTAGATGLFSLLTNDQTVSCFNAKVIRASAASLYSVPFLEGIPLTDLAKHGYRVWATVPKGGQDLFATEFQAPAAFVVGNEGRGIDPQTLDQISARLTVPMISGTESLNAGVVGSLIMYDVYRKTR